MPLIAVLWKMESDDECGDKNPCALLSLLFATMNCWHFINWCTQIGEGNTSRPITSVCESLATAYSDTSVHARTTRIFIRQIIFVYLLAEARGFVISCRITVWRRCKVWCQAETNRKKNPTKNELFAFFASSAHKYYIGISVVVTLSTIFQLLDSSMCTTAMFTPFLCVLFYCNTFIRFGQNICRQIVFEIILSRVSAIYYGFILCGIFLRRSQKLPNICLMLYLYQVPFGWCYRATFQHGSKSNATHHHFILRTNSLIFKLLWSEE